VQSGGAKVGEAKADLQGEWSVVLEKPLAAGDHSLSLKVTSPDGRLALSSQETVRVAVGADAKAGALPAGGEQAAKPAEAPLQAVAADSALTSQQMSQAAATPPPAAESDTTRALARSEQPAAAEGGGTGAVPPAKPKLVFKTVDYVDKGSGAGTVTITGTSEPGAEISITYGNESLAKTRADREGNWTVAIAKTLGMGQHSFRAERAGETAGMAGAAVVTIERVEPKPEPPATAVATATPAPQVAASQSQGIGSKIIYVIRRGDTLWAIAKRYLGSGLRYTSIFQDNRTTINNPDLIHPKQEVKVAPR
jgi:nucleoid-associated protein YgaU